MLHCTGQMRLSFQQGEKCFVKIVVFGPLSNVGCPSSSRTVTVLGAIPVEKQGPTSLLHELSPVQTNCFPDVWWPCCPTAAAPSAKENMCRRPACGYGVALLMLVFVNNADGRIIVASIPHTWLALLLPTRPTLLPHSGVVFTLQGMPRRLSTTLVAC